MPRVSKGGMNDSFNAFRKLKPDLTKDEFQPYYDQFIQSKPFNEYFKAFGQAQGFEASKFDSETIAILQRIFGTNLVADLLGCTPANVSLRAKGTFTAKNDARSLAGIPKLELGTDAQENYQSILDTMLEVVNNSETKLDRVKAAEALLKYYEPKVVDDLKNIRNQLNAMFDLIISRLIPEASKKIREIFRSQGIEANFDLRIIFRDILPKPSEVWEYLKQKGLMKGQ